MRSFIALKRCILDINVLMLIAVAGAIALGDYLEAGSVVFLFTLADWLESRSSDKARMAISSVASLAPQFAVLADSGVKVPVAKVNIGSILSVKAGENVPIDSVVRFGKGSADESTLTGESTLVEKHVGDSVWAGTLIVSGFLSIQTISLAEESVVSRMVKLVEEAQTQRSNVEKLVERFAKYYTPVVIMIAVSVAVVPLALHAHNVHHWLYFALVLLVVACPCALVISTPVATTCAIARAAKMGLIVKSGSALEALGKMKLLALDKTGTLTEGHFQVIDVQVLSPDIDLPTLLNWIACIESQSSHPMAASLVAYAKMYGVTPHEKVENFEILAGEGVSGVIEGHTIHIGNERMASNFSWIQSESAEHSLLENWRNQGYTISWIGLDRSLKGVLCAGDPLRKEAKVAVETMKKLGLQLIMLTGDSLASATVAQNQLRNQLDVHAQLFPQDKVDILRRMRTRSGCIGMVGDGINDAPALAAADVSIAMGVAGSAIAMETADIALMTNDLRRLAAAVKLGRHARWKILQNIILSLVTKFTIIILAAFGYASLWAAVSADVGTCLVVIFNSMLLLGREKSQHNHHCRSHHHHGHGHDHCQQDTFVHSSSHLCCVHDKDAEQKDYQKNEHNHDGCNGSPPINHDEENQNHKQHEHPTLCKENFDEHLHDDCCETLHSSCACRLTSHHKNDQCNHHTHHTHHTSDTDHLHYRHCHSNHEFPAPESEDNSHSLHTCSNFNSHHSSVRCGNGGRCHLKVKQHGIFRSGIRLKNQLNCCIPQSAIKDCCSQRHIIRSRNALMPESLTSTPHKITEILINSCREQGEQNKHAKDFDSCAAYCG
ncbi:hypothetical protein KP509_28G033300 [Ceratopteris richardii]|nr:hypothetical protein KP509_28G033300 [Ceratopteris richardii]